VPDGLCKGGVIFSPIETPPVTRVDQPVRLVINPDLEVIGMPTYFLLQQSQLVVGAAECNPQRQTNKGGFLCSENGFVHWGNIDLTKIDRIDQYLSTFFKLPKNRYSLL